MLNETPHSQAYQLRNLWLSSTTLLEAASMEDCVSAIKQLNSMGDPFSATELANRALTYHPKSVEIHQQRALGFLRCGATQTARSQLENTLNQFSENAETLALLGRSYKMDTITYPVPKAEQGDLKKALTYYNRAWRISGDTYPAINAATIAYVLGHQSAAESLAKEILDVCLERLNENRTYWKLATLGEAYLLLGEEEKAKTAYLEACEIGEDNWADITSTRKQARLILRSRGQDLTPWDKVFHLGAITVFSGHVADPQNTAPESKRLGRDDIEALSERIDAWVKENRVRFGFASAASGGDLLFLESVIRHGGDAHVVLPFSLESFKKECIAPAGSDIWESKLNWVLQNASSINLLNPFAYSGDPVDFEFASEILLGKAMLIGDQLDLAVHGLSVWDGKPARGKAGTAENLSRWIQKGFTVTNIWRQSHNSEVFVCSEAEALDVSQEAGGDTIRHSIDEVMENTLFSKPNKQIKAILFADVSGYTKLPEAEIPDFVSRFLGLCSEIMSRPEFIPDVANTWGDALFAVFPTASKAAHFASALMTEATMSDIFSVDLNLRIGLHAGPVYECYDPIQRCITYTGTHVSLAARLEPMAEEGQIYASEYFAALAKAEEDNSCRFEFLGEKPLDKNMKPMRIYKVV